MVHPHRVLVTGAGGAPATNYVRSLRLAPEQFYLIGVDCSPYHLPLAETDETPQAVQMLAEANYRVRALNAVSTPSGEDVDLVFASAFIDEVAFDEALPLTLYRAWTLNPQLRARR